MKNSKKFLSLLIAIMVVVSCMASFVWAEETVNTSSNVQIDSVTQSSSGATPNTGSGGSAGIQLKKTVRYEAETYNTVTSVVTKADNPDVSEGMYIRATEASKANDPDFVIPVTIQKTGYYNVTYVVGKDAGPSTSGITFTLGETLIGTNNDSGAEKIESYTDVWNGFMPMSRYKKTMLWIEASDYSLNVDFSTCFPTTTKEVYTFQFDYIEFEYVDTTVGSLKRFEFEDFNVSGEDFIDSNASGGSYARIKDWNGVESASCGVKLNISMSGYYDIAYVMGKKGNYVSKVTLSLDETVIGTNADTVSETYDTYGTFNQYMQMSKFEKSLVWIEKGDYTLNVTVDVVSASDNVCKFQLDYIEFDLVGDISTEDPTRFEFEDYCKYGKLFDDAEASKESYFRIADWNGVADDPSFSVYILVEKSGYYDISYVMGKNGAHVSLITVSLGDTLIGTNDYQTVETVTDYGVFASYMQMSKFANRRVWIEEGYYPVNFTFDKVSASTAVYKYQLDYLEIAPSKSAVITDSDATRIEAEDYTTQTMAVTANEKASGRGHVATMGKKVDPSFAVTLDVTKAGYYDFQYVIGKKMQAFDALSTITLKLDDAVIGTNTEAVSDMTQLYTWSNSNYLGVVKFTKEKIWLDAKEYVFSVNVALSNDNYYKYQMDYFEFMPSGILETDGETVTASVCYDEAVSGTPFLAIYNGEALVCVKEFDVVENKRVVKLSNVCTEEFDKVKMFIWDSREGMNPKIQSVTYTK